MKNIKLQTNFQHCIYSVNKICRFRIDKSKQRKCKDLGSFEFSTDNLASVLSNIIIRVWVTEMIVFCVKRNTVINSLLEIMRFDRKKLRKFGCIVFSVTI
ncbi:hypothetical protein HHI36_022936 [Cryptolaemus montrouzieri]|uniref:Uncharacterized protein n=1 Tax=Cryptolaemus montrouzieri TaxID=559131 RepID=A0ABD2PEW7_9CUCU